ncbi:aminoglycoside phosphotransferase family protein [Kribbella sp. NPDC048915]|uniref:aminoglycoside phosphotransferase family protein n=1 Tax=Kribbella sp. NPDC048915 TaxID=3155148 RepID=UPI0033ECE443
MHLRRGDSDAWRLDTSAGSYFVKGYLPSAGDLGQLARAMAFERSALRAGVPMPRPVTPLRPLLGWLTQIEGRLFRAHHWVPAGPAVDVSAWLAQTMLQVHQLPPLRPGALPSWWRGCVRSAEVWEGWLLAAGRRDRGWAALLEQCLPTILAVTSRISAIRESVPDLVTTHGDFKPHNVIMSPSGPVLVDWDSVRTDSTALEAARTAYIFAAGNPDRVTRILATYTASGGNLTWPGTDLFLSVLRNHLQVLTDQIDVSLGNTAPARWMPAALEDAISNNLRSFPRRTTALNQLATTCATQLANRLL